MAYPGGKGGSGVAQTIVNQQPPHEVYIEAFLGGGAVLRAKRPAARNVALDRSAAALDAWRGVDLGAPLELRHGCALDYLEARRWSGRELVYLDPPYLRSTRRSARDLYAHELDDDDHRRLLATARGLPAAVQVSGYWSPLYAEALADWRLLRFPSQTRAGTAEECLWMNYPPPAALHDYRYLGADFRQRERIKRKVRRWSAGLARLPELERQAVLSGLLEAEE